MHPSSSEHLSSTPYIGTKGKYRLYVSSTHNATQVLTVVTVWEILAGIVNAAEWKIEREKSAWWSHFHLCSAFIVIFLCFYGQVRAVSVNVS